VSDHALLLSPNLNAAPWPVDPRLAELKRMVRDSAVSPYSSRRIDRSTLKGSGLRDLDAAGRLRRVSGTRLFIYSPPPALPTHGG
jgi:hypothetical protein